MTRSEKKMGSYRYLLDLAMIVTPVLLKVVFAPGTAPVPEQIVPEVERVTSYYENRGQE